MNNSGKKVARKKLLFTDQHQAAYQQQHRGTKPSPSSQNLPPQIFNETIK